MANCYGTKEHTKFTQEQLALGKDGEWILKDRRTESYGDYELQYATYSSSLKTYDNFVYDHGELSVYNNGKLIYVCNDMYNYHSIFFYLYSINNCDYLMFRKEDLYGYTILNLTTLEEHNYFPDVVLNREKESFIIVKATLLKDILVLYGCHWACPCIYYLLDAKTYKTHMLCHRDTDDAKTKIDNNALTIFYDDGDKPESQSFIYDELVELLKNSSSYDM